MANAGMPPGSMTIAQMREQSNPPTVDAIYDSFIEQGGMGIDIPIRTNAVTYDNTKLSIGGLPLPTWAPLNGSPGQVLTNYKDYTESVFRQMDNLDIDKLAMLDKRVIGTSLADKQIKSYLAGKAFDLDNKLINNDHAVTGVAAVDSAVHNVNAPIGFKYRLNNPGQYNVNPQMLLQGTADISDSGLTQSQGIKLFKNWQTMLDNMDRPNGDGVYIYANDDALRCVDAAAKTMGTSGGFKITEDQFGRTVLKYRNAIVKHVSRLAPLDDGTQTQFVITSTESIAGVQNPAGDIPTSTYEYTSFYFLKYGDDYVSAWQMEAPSMIKERVSGTRDYRVMFDWTLGLWIPDTRSFGRIQGIKVGSL